MERLSFKYKPPALYGCTVYVRHKAYLMIRGYEKINFNLSLYYYIVVVIVLIYFSYCFFSLQSIYTLFFYFFYVTLLTKNKENTSCYFACTYISSSGSTLHTCTLFHFHSAIVARCRSGMTMMMMFK